MTSLLTAKDLHALRELWLADWETGRVPAGGEAQRWFDVVTTFLEQRGDLVTPNALLAREERALTAGLAQEYLAALAEVIDASHSRSESETAILILTASNEDRAEALTRIGVK